jgi:hypothetical protein
LENDAFAGYLSDILAVIIHGNGFSRSVWPIPYLRQLLPQMHIGLSAPVCRNCFGKVMSARLVPFAETVSAVSQAWRRLIDIAKSAPAAAKRYFTKRYFPDENIP